MAIRTLAMPLKMAMMNEAMAEMTALIAYGTSAVRVDHRTVIGVVKPGGCGSARKAPLT
jgi:hypothetical protein